MRRTVFADVAAVAGSAHDRESISRTLSSKATERFLLKIVAIPSCTLQAIDCLRVLDNAAFRRRVLDDVLIERLCGNLEITLSRPLRRSRSMSRTSLTSPAT
jgi:hypothetical protein